MGLFVTLKKLDPDHWFQKAGSKNQGHCYLKREEARLHMWFHAQHAQNILNGI